MAGWQDAPLVEERPSVTFEANPDPKKSMGLPPSPGRDSVVKFWVSKGAPQHVAEGIADRVNIESGFSPTISGDGGTSVGLYQHHADRMERLKQQKNWQDPNIQNEFAFSEVTGGDPTASAHWKEILAAPDRKAATELWTKYFERPATGWAGAPVVGSGKWNVSDDAIRHGMSIPDASVEWMPAKDYLAMLPPLEGDAANRAKRSSLQKSLDAGDQIQDLPSLDVKRDGSKLKVIDYDGRNRAETAIQEGVDLIPVVVRGAGKGDRPSQIEGISGKAISYDFKPVTAPAQKPAPQTGLDRFGTGVTDPVVGAAQLAAHARMVDPAAAPFLPPETLQEMQSGKGAETFDKAVKEREAAYERGREAAGSTGTDGWRLGGRVAGTLPLAALGAGGGLMGAVAGGAALGVASGLLEPVTQGNYGRAATTNALVGGGIGAIAGPLGYVAARLIAPPVRSLANQARTMISNAFADRAAGSGNTAGNVLGQMGSARAEGQPMTLADIPELQGLAGAVSRATGEAGSRIRAFFAGRKDDALRRLDDLLARYFPTGSVKRTIEEVADQRAEAAAPVYAEAYAGGSIAPLERQLQAEWNSAAGVAKNAEQTVKRLEGELNQALARQSQAGNVYSASGSNRQMQFVKDKIAEQRKIAEEAREAEQAGLQRLRQAQQDGTANAPGAIWSPTIQRLLSNPDVQVGIRRGMRIERNLANAEGRPMRLSEYAVTGMDENGDPIVGAVPNMKLLAAAKKGLDAMVADMRHTEPPWRLTELGRSVDQLRRTLLDELYRLNPKYREANEIWSSGAETMRAMTDGQRALDRRVSIEDVRDQLQKLPEGAKDFYRLGVADDIRKDLANIALTSDKSKAVINTEGAREKLRAIMGSPEAADRFIQAVENERTMFNTGRTITGGSQTAERLADDSMFDRILAMGHGVNALAHLSHGNVTNALLSMARLARGMRMDNRLANNPALANEIAKLLTTPALPMSREGALLNALPVQPRPLAQRGAAEAFRLGLPFAATQAASQP